jgi:hypothetical protein
MELEIRFNTKEKDLDLPPSLYKITVEININTDRGISSFNREKLCLLSHPQFNNKRINKILQFKNFMTNIFIMAIQPDHQ